MARSEVHVPCTNMNNIYQNCGREGSVDFCIHNMILEDTDYIIKIAACNAC